MVNLDNVVPLTPVSAFHIMDEVPYCWIVICYDSNSEHHPAGQYITVLYTLPQPVLIFSLGRFLNFRLFSIEKSDSWTQKGFQIGFSESEYRIFELEELKISARFENSLSEYFIQRCAVGSLDMSYPSNHDTFHHIVTSTPSILGIFIIYSPS